jgi:hypothetical protein
VHKQVAGVVYKDAIDDEPADSEIAEHGDGIARSGGHAPGETIPPEGVHSDLSGQIETLAKSVGTAAASENGFTIPVWSAPPVETESKAVQRIDEDLRLVVWLSLGR